MLLIAFTTEDLARVSFRGLDPWAEAVMSIRMLRDGVPGGAPGLGAWRRAVAREVADRRLGPRLRAFADADPILAGQAALAHRDVVLAGPAQETVPPQAPVPKISVPKASASKTSASKTSAPGSTAATTPPAHVQAAKTPVAEGLDLDALDLYRTFAIEPYRRRISALIEAELHARGTALMQGGHARALDGLGSHSYWAGSVLTAHSPEHREVQLGGNGLELLPSFFCPTTHVLLAGPEERPTLVYPVGSGPAAVALAEDAALLRDTFRRDLAALLGSTRATALEAISESCSTTELARRLHTSLATASQHAAVLRGTGLVSTARCGRQVRHTLTPLGHRLLQGSVLAEAARQP